MSILSAEHYTYRVRWSPEDEAFISMAAEMPSLSWVDDLLDGAFSGIRDLVKGVIDDMIETGGTPPQAIADRTYSGKFMVRIAPESHRQLASCTAQGG